MLFFRHSYTTQERVTIVELTFTGACVIMVGLVLSATKILTIAVRILAKMAGFGFESVYFDTHQVVEILFHLIHT